MIWILLVLLILSLIVNVLMIWYVRKILVNFYALSENFESFFAMIVNYADHLENVHGLEMFYGDETLMSLIDHTKFVAESIRTVEGFYSFLGPWEPIEYDTDQEEEEKEE
jgi:hypothetical protein